FAQFFIGPLMSADATNREINAVHSEHTKNLISDPWRINQLQKSFCSPQHPFYKFNVGSLETLKEVPEASGRDIRQELVAFYEKYYSANLMHLVVYGKGVCCAVLCCAVMGGTGRGVHGVCAVLCCAVL
ncbi:unnamed protein product, partial [Closterium sp. NIES-53]